MPRTVLDRSDAVRALAGVFRRRGFESGSLSVIQQETGIGRGSLYHFFPNGKADMAGAVLAQVRDWFDHQVFEPLRTADDAAQAVTLMSQVVEEYFASRDRVCLFAAMTLGEEQETFAREVRSYFADWVSVLAETLHRGGIAESDAADLAVDAVAAIQGGLIMTRALDDDAVFTGIVSRIDRRLHAALT
ncbi:DNA-binding transcriptional regulator, AcrR family [Pseudarthrobacter equi]|uniref:DNA-binding transcriptional regulator, AcrR family n=2 Tax=Pseudarthrobacter equi TaxID=728066 RepID=A0A1H1T7W0_9MICC|nr:TetR/AcrR family transcriptional regulator [Pseudarthrobacter equi]SDS56213.1 DNA-binding transcriptional regulator, AcrR family [Pseudarthrobacter equi]